MQTEQQPRCLSPSLPISPTFPPSQYGRLNHLNDRQVALLFGISVSLTFLGWPWTCDFSCLSLQRSWDYGPLPPGRAHASLQNFMFIAFIYFVWVYVYGGGAVGLIFPWHVCTWRSEKTVGSPFHHGGLRDGTRNCVGPQTCRQDLYPPNYLTPPTFSFKGGNNHHRLVDTSL